MHASFVGGYDEREPQREAPHRERGQPRRGGCDKSDQAVVAVTRDQPIPVTGRG